MRNNGAANESAKEGFSYVCANYGRVTSLALDPIEKKPIAFFRPGCKVLSVGSYGCNMRCPFCQNDAISQRGEDAASFQTTTPPELADAAWRLKARPYDLYAVGLWYAGRRKEALAANAGAMRLSPNDKRLKNNQNVMQELMSE